MCQASLSSLRELNGTHYDSEKNNGTLLVFSWVYILCVLKIINLILLFDEYNFMWNLEFDDPIISLFINVIHFTLGISVCMMTFAKIYLHRMFYRHPYVYMKKYLLEKG